MDKNVPLLCEKIKRNRIPPENGVDIIVYQVNLLRIFIFVETLRQDQVCSKYISFSNTPKKKKNPLILA